MAIKVEMIDELLKEYKTSADIFGENGLVKQFVKAVSERAIQAELTTHLGYEKLNNTYHTPESTLRTLEALE